MDSTVDIRFCDLKYSVRKGLKKDKKTVLDSVSGGFKSGELTAILGPSGAGKTSLMNILAGAKTTSAEGKVFVNNRERDVRQYRKITAYITQKDYLLPHLTVLEYLNFSVQLKLPHSMPWAKKTEAVDHVIDILGLDLCRSTRVANLSGGECKRLSIALELVSNPRIIFLDEPTSGLDSRSSLQCVGLLKRIAASGRVIVATIHQPSARLLEQFDNLYVISKGKCIYNGQVNQLVPFLGSLSLKCPNFHNPADFVIDVASSEEETVVTRLVNQIENGRKEQRANGLFLENSAEREVNSNVKGCETTALLPNADGPVDFDGSFTVPFWKQFFVLLYRTFLCIWREKMVTLLRFVTHIVVGILMGFLYWRIGNDASRVHSNAGLIFFTQLFLLFTAMMPTVLTFPLERYVLVREHLNHWYSLKSYYLAKTTADLPFQIVFPTIYVAIVYFMTNQIGEIHRFFMLLLMSILLSLVAQGIGLLIGAAADIQVAVFLGPALTIPFLLFSGFFLVLSAIPSYLRWISYISFIRYVFEGSLLSIYGGERPHLECNEPYCHFESPAKFLEEFDMAESDYWLDVICLLVQFLMVRVAGYLVLKWKIRQSR